jgi:hypothetical protein
MALCVVAALTHSAASCLCRCWCVLFHLAGATLHLDGIDAFDAATHCAALTAAERISKQQQQAAEAAQAEQPAAASAEPQQQAFDAAATQLPSGGDAASCPGAAGGPAPMGVQQ